VAANYDLGGVLVAVGAVLVAFHRPLGALQVRSQPRWMHPWKNATAGSGAVILVVGIAVMIAGLLAMFPLRSC
jgi:hypothetical protein